MTVNNAYLPVISFNKEMNWEMFGLSKTEVPKKNHDAAILTYNKILESVRFFETYNNPKLPAKKAYNNRLGILITSFNEEYRKAREYLRASFKQYLGNKNLENHLKIFFWIRMKGNTATLE